MRLHRLIYLSHAKVGLQYPDLMDIMAKSEVNNARIGITGMLCLGNAIFLQILEGSRKAINDTYLRIAHDDRHHHPEIIDFAESPTRSFSAWSMKLVQLDASASPDVQSLILKYSGFQQFSPDTMSAAQCLQFMQALHLHFSQ